MQQAKAYANLHGIDTTNAVSCESFPPYQITVPGYPTLSWTPVLYKPRTYLIFVHHNNTPLALHDFVKDMCNQAVSTKSPGYAIYHVFA